MNRTDENALNGKPSVVRNVCQWYVMGEYQKGKNSPYVLLRDGWKRVSDLMSGRGRNYRRMFRRMLEKAVEQEPDQPLADEIVDRVIAEMEGPDFLVDRYVTDWMRTKTMPRRSELLICGEWITLKEVGHRYPEIALGQRAMKERAGLVMLSDHPELFLVSAVIGFDPETMEKVATSFGKLRSIRESERSRRREEYRYERWDDAAIPGDYIWLWPDPISKFAPQGAELSLLCARAGI